MAWKITKDRLWRGPEDGATREGYGEEHERIPVVAAVIGFQSEPLPSPENEHPNMVEIPFRLKDDDGEVYYEGLLHDDDHCRNQISCQKWGEDDAGCTTIEVMRDGLWTQEIR